MRLHRFGMAFAVACFITAVAMATGGSLQLFVRFFLILLGIAGVISVVFGLFWLSPSRLIFALHRYGHQQFAAKCSGLLARFCWSRYRRLFWVLNASVLHYSNDEWAKADDLAKIGLDMTRNTLDRLKDRAYYGTFLEMVGRVAVDKGQYGEAYVAYRQGFGIFQNVPASAAKFSIGCSLTLFQMGEFEEAITCARQLLHDSVRLPLFWKVLAHGHAASALAEMGDFDSALMESSKALTLEVDKNYRLLAWVTQGWILYLNGKTPEAEAAFVEAKRLTSTNSPYQSLFFGLRGRMRLCQDRLDEAGRDLNTAMACEKRVYPFIWYSLMILNQKRSNDAQSKHWRERLLREVPESFYAERVRQAGEPVW